MRKLKRFIAACFAMNGFVSMEDSCMSFSDIARDSYRMADELLKQENL